MSVKRLSIAARYSNCTARDVVKSASIAGRHTFSTSSIRRRHGAVPQFTPTSSPELDSLLDLARRKMILPAHLSKEQQHLIYSSKNKKLLASESAKAMIGDEEFTLEFIDRTRDYPSGHKVLWQAISMMKEQSDWTNLPRLLHGLNNADMLKFDAKRREWMREKLVQKMGQAGRQDILLECIRQSAHTGLTLKDGVFTVQVLVWFQMKAAGSDYEAEATSKSLKWAKLVATMMEDPSHTGLKNSTGSSWLVSEIPGMLLGLAAVRASKHLGGVDKEGDVAKYAQRLVQSLPSEPNDTPSAGWTLPAVPEAYSKWLRQHVPILYGMKQAATVLDQTSDLAKQLETRTNDLEATIRKYGKDALARSQEGWLEEYTKLFPNSPIN